MSEIIVLREKLKEKTKEKEEDSMVCYDSPIKIVLDTCSINRESSKYEVLQNKSNKINERQSKIAEV